MLQEQLSQNLFAQVGSSKRWSEFTLSPFFHNLQVVKDDDSSSGLYSYSEGKIRNMKHFPCVIDLSICYIPNQLRPFGVVSIH